MGATNSVDDPEDIFSGINEDKSLNYLLIDLTDCVIMLGDDEKFLVRGIRLRSGASIYPGQSIPPGWQDEGDFILIDDIRINKKITIDTTHQSIEFRTNSILLTGEKFINVLREISRGENYAVVNPEPLTIGDIKIYLQ